MNKGLGENTSLYDMTVALKNIIKEEIKVATLGYYTQTVKPYSESDGYGIIQVKPFPLKKDQSEYVIQAYVLDDRTFVENKIVIILFLDLNFKSNLSLNVKKPAQVNDNLSHSINYGVVI